MSKFKIPKRYDAAIADAGVWFSMETEAGDSYGEFRCALIDKTTPRYKLAAKRLLAARQRNKSEGLKMAAEMMLEFSLLDWKVNDAKGKPVPFCREDAIEYFTDPDAEWLLDMLWERASDALNYQPEPETGDDSDEEATEKNS